MRLVITGGAGFVGSTLALAWKRDHSDDEVVSVDNLQGRGSALAAERLAAGGVQFVRADARGLADLREAEGAELVIDCAADPSVKSGYSGGVGTLLSDHLATTLGCLDLCERDQAGLIFLSTSRVHPIAGLRALPLEPVGQRLELPQDASGPGWSRSGIGPGFPLAGYRSPYGASKLTSELAIEEYAHTHGLRAVVNRCGVISGPWQMGSVDQGFVALWAARHLWGDALRYTGFDGEGLQVRDVLHVADLYELIVQQARGLQPGFRLHYVGGGPERATSLRELTAACEARAGRSIEIRPEPTTHPSDVPYYVTDLRTLRDETGWSPSRSLSDLLDDVFDWLRSEREVVKGHFT